jgi:inhibitor of KinA sporulation pathway (predicted exonuclease)
MFNLPKKIVVFDTEYTSWEGSQERAWSGPNEYREVVQIGAVRVETEKFEELDAFDMYVRPMKNRTLSDYFISLTGITQEIIDRDGVSFPEALEKFYSWSDGQNLFCFGSDGAVLEENAGFHGIPFSLKRSRFFDIRDVFTERGIPARDFMSSTIPEAFGEKPSRRGHSAIGDARSIVDGLRLLAELETSH